MARDERLEGELEAKPKPVPGFLQPPRPESRKLQIEMPLAGGVSDMLEPLTAQVTDLGLAIPIAIVEGINDVTHPAITANLTQIVDPDNDVRVLTPTSPGTGGITINDHIMELGFVTVEDIRSLQFFDDGVVIKSTSPATKFYDGASWPGSNRVFNSDNVSGDDDAEEIILKFPASVDEIRIIDIGLNSGSAVINPPDSVTNDYALDAAFRIDLIKVPMDSGDTFFLEDLTWNSANRDSGTLFATPANFEVGDFWYRFDLDVTDWTTGAAPPPHTAQEALAVSHINLPFSAVRNNGPYFGIIIHIAEAQIIPGVSVNSANAQFAIANPRSSGAAAKRSWILSNGPFT